MMTISWQDFSQDHNSNSEDDHGYDDKLIDVEDNGDEDNYKID